MTTDRRSDEARKQVDAALNAFLQTNPRGRLRVGFSGGRDSTVLLTALAALNSARERDLRAVHIDHGLHPESGTWADRARAVAAQLQLPIEVSRVDLSDRREVGTEAKAREARREVYAEHLDTGDWILLAHHREDQAETLLLRLLSGAGLPGLGAMRTTTSFAAGWIGRPLLGLSSSVIEACAQALAINPILDPANSDPQHERSWLRTEIMPQLARRHPEVSARLARTADWLQQCAHWMAKQAGLERAQRQGLDPNSLDVSGWPDLPQPLRYEVLAGWLESIGQARPGVVAFAHIESDLIAARVDANPQLRWGAGTLRRYRQSLAWVAERPALDPGWSATWAMELELPLPGAYGRLRAVAAEPGAKAQRLRVCARSGGERFKQASNRPSRPLQHWLQELGVPPWERQRLLLLHDQSDRLVAVLALDSAAVIVRNEALAGWVFEIDASD